MRVTSADKAIGGYRIVRRIGEGSVAIVYEVVDPRNGRRLALKALRQVAADDEDARAHFHREARALMALEHENVVTTYDYSGADATEPFIASELLDGQSLKEIVAARGALPTDVALGVFVQVLRGLSAAHAQGMIHRDLSLANLFVENSGRVVVTDFGLVAALGRRDSETFVTRGTGVIGTPLYLAPEILNGRPYSAASDLYALGIGLAYALLGAPPFATNDLPKLLAAILEARVLPQTPDAPELFSLARRLTEFDPSDRPSLATMLGELEERSTAENATPLAVARWLDAQNVTRIASLASTIDLLRAALLESDYVAALSIATAGRYEIGGLLGEGGMGKVYEAREKQSGRSVAIKVMVDHDDNPKNRLRFHREARAIGRLHHPNIISLIDYSGRDSALPYLVLERLRGATLAAVSEVALFPENEALCVALVAADALCAVHESGVVHRDLKPENIFAEADGRVVIADFGIVIGTGSAPELTLARQRTVAIGSPQYASPEQIFEPDNVGPASDLFSLGSVLHNLVTGEPPLPATTLNQALQMLSSGESSPLPRTLSDPFRALVSELRARAPADRPASAAVVRDRVQALLSARRIDDPREKLQGFWGGQKLSHASDLGGSAANTQVATLRKPPIAPRQNRRAIGWLLAVAALGASALAFEIVTRRGEERNEVVLTAPTAPKPSPQPLALPEPTPVPPPPITPPPPPVTPAPHALDSAIRHAKPSPPALVVTDQRPGTLRFITVPWAHVSVDGTELGTTPFFNSAEVSEGRHVVRFTNPTHQTLEQVVIVKHGEVKELRVTLSK